MSKQTAVEWLVDQLFKQGYFDGNKPLSITNLDHLQHQAKAMEREQNETFFEKGYERCEWEHSVGAYYEKEKPNFDEYYNETYKGGTNE